MDTKQNVKPTLKPAETKPTIKTLASLFFEMGVDKTNKTKKQLAEKMLAYYQKIGYKGDATALKIVYKNKKQPLSVEYIIKFINSCLPDFKRKTGWRAEYKVVADENTWHIAKK
jgi:hypothetical protein